MRNWFVLGTMLLAAACGSDSKNPAPTVTCGAGTMLSGDTCVPTGSGSTTTCGAGTHLDGTTCVPDGGGTPGAPTISGMSPTEAGATGFVLFAIAGTDLAGSDPTMVHVYFGDTTPGTSQNPNPCEAEVVPSADGTVITGEVPPMCSLSSAVTVTVVTDKGMATTPFTYDALWAADGDIDANQTGGDIYIIDPFAHLWFDLGQVADANNNTYNFDALAFDSTGGFWAATTGNSLADTTGVPQLVSINLSTGAITNVGALTDGTDSYYVTDMKFGGATLYAWGYNYTATTPTEALVSIDTTSGAVTVIGTPTTTTYGVSGFAIDSAGVAWVAAGGASSGDTNLTQATGDLSNVNLTDGTLTNVQTLDYSDVNLNPIGAPIDSMDFVAGTLLAVIDNGLYGQITGQTQISGRSLAVIDPTVAAGSGNTFSYFELPAQPQAQSNVSALAMAPATLAIARKLPHGTWKPLASATKPVAHR